MIEIKHNKSIAYFITYFRKLYSFKHDEQLL